MNIERTMSYPTFEILLSMRIILLSLIIAVVGQFFFMPITYSQSSQAYLVDAGEFDCIPIENFGLKGVRLWEPEETIKSLLGEPESMSHSGSEDDGGYYDITIYHYPGLVIEAIRQHVDRITATSPEIVMSSGIRLGDSRADVRAKFGRKPRSLSRNPKEIHLVTCPKNGEWVQEDYVTLEFNTEGKLTSIRYEANRP
jgi:hypothetical protein